MFKVYEGSVDKKWEDILPNYKGYWRMYFRGGWDGTWLPYQGASLHGAAVTELNAVIREVTERWPKGYNAKMERDLLSLATPLTSEGKNYLLLAEGLKMSFLIYVNTEFGNADYPVRIYCYGKQ